jgi:putative tricarboxylic transport membrane protein
MLFGLTAITAFSGKGQVLKAVLMALLGLMLATVGQDPSGIQRFTLGIPDLYDGVSFLLLSMATFAIAEALMVVLRPSSSTQDVGSSDTSFQALGSMKLSKEEIKDVAPTVARSSVLGFFVGILPGAGATIASFLAYGMERNLASVKEKLRFGKGSLRGLAAPETANNAASTGSFVPLLTLGIPGSATTAIMLGALLSYGVQPGPRLYIDYPAVFWSVIISMYLGNIILLILNLPLIPYISKLLDIPRQFLTPIILFLSLIGVYLVSFNTVDLLMMVIIGVIAVVFRVLNFPLAPLLLGFILGGMLEENLRRALLISDGSLEFLWQRPITATIIVITIATLLIPVISSLKKTKRVAQH